jgi:hypothetical protein
MAIGRAQRLPCSIIVPDGTLVTRPQSESSIDLKPLLADASWFTIRPMQTERNSISPQRPWTIAAITGVAFLALALASPPLASAELSFSRPSPSRTTVGVAEAVAVTGTLQGGGELIVYMLPPGSECPNALQFEGAEAFAGKQMFASTTVLPNASIVGRTPVGESFSATYSVVPPGIGNFMLCGYAFRLPSFYPATVTGHEALEALAPPEHLTALGVSERMRRGKTANMPGETELLVRVNPEAEVMISVTHDGHTTRNPVDPDGPSTGKPLTLGILWSCNKPRGIYAWSITASDAYGARLRRSGSFRSPLNAAKCRALRISDARRKAARHREAKLEAEQERRREESPQFKIEAAEDEYCTKVLGGEYTGSFTAAGHIYSHCVVSQPFRHTVVVGK